MWLPAQLGSTANSTLLAHTDAGNFTPKHEERHLSQCQELDILNILENIGIEKDTTFWNVQIYLYKHQV